MVGVGAKFIPEKGKFGCLFSVSFIDSLVYLTTPIPQTIPQVQTMSTLEKTGETAGDTPAQAPSDDAPTVETLDKKYVEDTPNAEFATLLEESDTQSYREVSTGEKVTGTLREIGESTAFIDFGGRGEASIDIQELRDKSGELKYKTGDSIEAFVASTDGEIRLTFSLRVSSRQLLRQAHQNGMPHRRQSHRLQHRRPCSEYRRPSGILPHVANRYGILQRPGFICRSDLQLQNCRTAGTQQCRRFTPRLSGRRKSKKIRRNAPTTLRR